MRAGDPVRRQGHLARVCVGLGAAQAMGTPLPHAVSCAASNHRIGGLRTRRWPATESAPCRRRGPFEYAHRPRGGVFRSKLDVASSSLVSRSRDPVLNSFRIRNEGCGKPQRCGVCPNAERIDTKQTFGRTLLGTCQRRGTRTRRPRLQRASRKRYYRSKRAFSGESQLRPFH